MNESINYWNNRKIKERKENYEVPNFGGNATGEKFVPN
jgi:hypothetical protein